MGILHLATFTIAIQGASDDELDAAAAAFTCTLHRASLTPGDALAAWHRMDEWERAKFRPEADPGRHWRHTMSIAREAAMAALRAAGFEGQQCPFIIQSGCARH
jgi:sucrose-6-phosphate hydrolase SacC (GH32 family)